MKNIKSKKQNQLRAWLALTWYSLLSSLRNPSNLFFGFLFPFIFITVFGLLDGGNRTYQIPLRPSSEQIENNLILEILEKVDPIEITTDSTNEEIDEELNKGQRSAAITIDFNEETQNYNVLLETSAADPEDAAIVRSIIEGIIYQVNFPEDGEIERLINLEEEVVAGRKYTQIDFILPGQLAFALLSTGVFSIVFTFISLREQLVIKRIFATPTSKWQILTSEAVAKLINGALQAIIIIGAGTALYGFTLANGFSTFLSMIVLSIIGLIVFLSFGLFASSLAKTEEGASPIANLITLPQFLLSGAFFPIDVFPDFLQPIARIIPMTHLTDAMRAVSFEGATLIDVLPEIAALAVWAVVMYAIVIKVFKWE